MREVASRRESEARPRDHFNSAFLAPKLTDRCLFLARLLAPSFKRSTLFRASISRLLPSFVPLHGRDGLIDQLSLDRRVVALQ
jgi:hypothetical protein